VGCAMGSIAATGDVPGYDVIASAILAEDADCLEFSYRILGRVGRHLVGLSDPRWVTSAQGFRSPVADLMAIEAATRRCLRDRAQVPTSQASDGPSSILTARRVMSACLMSSSDWLTWGG
jgi:hypothetical protein